MNDQTTVRLPDIPRDRTFEKRGEDYVGIEPSYRFARHRVIDVELYRNLVAAFGKLNVKAL
jgi:hypothetical protein